jgi:DNA-binding PadR family transcriptional regulator
MSDVKLTPSLLAMMERIEQHSGTLLLLAVTASGGQDGKLNKLRGAGYVVKCDHPTVTDGAWPAEALAITEAGRTALAKHRAEIAGKKRAESFRRQKGDLSSRRRTLHSFSRGRSDRVCTPCR